MELRVHLSSADEADHSAQTDLTGLLGQFGIPYDLDRTHDPRAMGPDPVVVITLSLSVLATVCTILNTVVGMRQERRATVKAGELEAPVDGDEGRLGERLHSWLFPAGKDVDAPGDR